MAEMGLMDFVKEAKSRINEVDVDTAEQLINDEGYRVLDIREHEEYEAGTIGQSLHVPRGLLEAAADRNFPDANPALRDSRDEKWLVLCASGGRAAMATNRLQMMGFESVINVEGGITAWKGAGKPMTQPNLENNPYIKK
ncbi:MAG: Sulfurtransferase [uncultured Thiotrichaceae bacterium]|uniref:Sulfurtransferase n=1 Tax=uncultured Thiotrichaceae bacterium TaxID=298394 RepID=A0A6S6TE85_9GAMM|nr:MAG: Sulfurtransferase [uncultured Thiotrichaceae bacterium]